MKNILKYLKNNIDEKATIEKWNAKKYLNLQLAGNYDYEMYAVYENITTMIEYQVSKAKALIEDLPEIQIMQYDIGRLTQSPYVDPITLISSIDQKDDRIEIAIDELMEGVEWYEA